MKNQGSLTARLKTILEKYWFLPAFVVYVLVFWRSLAFVYIEGDDATSIAYHLLGRNIDLQLPYSPYQGMMDTLLSIIPPQEDLLRVIGFGLTSLACIVFGYLVSRLVFEWNKRIPPTAKPLVPLLIVLAAPELLYLGLSYKPTLIAIDLLLCSHLLLRSIVTGDITTTKNRIPFILSILLFGLGVSFRWNTIVYGAVIVADVFFVSLQGIETRKRTGFCLGWGIPSIVISAIAIYLSNLKFFDLSHAVNTMGMVLNQVGTEGSNAYLSMVLGLSPLFTPAMAILSIAGFYVIVRKKDKVWIPVLVGFLGILPWLRSGAPKNLITFIPELVLCFSVGLLAIWGIVKPAWLKYVIRAAFLAALLTPWFIGVRIVWGDTAWGPGFELKSFDRPEMEENQLNIAFASGSAFPTPGIPRPVYGYFDNLIGGSLKRFELDFSRENNRVVDTAISENLPILMTSWSPDFFVIDLYTRGFATKDAAYNASSIGKDLYQREFIKGEGQPVWLYHGEISDDDGEVISQRVLEFGGRYQQLILVGYPGTMRSLYLFCPAALDPIGAASAIVDMKTLAEGSCGTD